MLWVIEPARDILLSKALLHDLSKRVSLCVINKPTALVNALPTLINMIKDGWVTEIGRKEWVRYRVEGLVGEFAVWFRFVVVINGITTSVLLYRSA
jgi:TolB-like protein